MDMLDMESELPFQGIGMIEVVLLDPLIAEEAVMIIDMFKKQDLEAKVCSSGRIISVETEDLVPVIVIVSQFGLYEDIGMIKQTIEYHPTAIHPSMTIH